MFYSEISDLDRTEFEADLLAWQESEEGQEWTESIREELAADLAAAAANERALREQEDAGFTTLAEQAEAAGAAAPEGPFDVEYQDSLRPRWQGYLRGYRTLVGATAAAVELVTMECSAARRARVRTQRKQRIVGREWITLPAVTLAEFERAAVAVVEVALPLAA